MTINCYTWSCEGGQTEPIAATWRRVYYFRQRIPKDLLQHYAPKLEHIYSLKTTDHREAERLTRLESVRWDAEFERVRNHRSVDLATFTDAAISSLAEGWAASYLEEDEERRIRGITEELHDAYSPYS